MGTLLMQPTENIARLCHPDGELLLSVQTPYDVTNLLDQVDWYAKRYGDIRLELGSDHWRVSAHSNPRRRCPECSAEENDLVFTDHGHRLCKRCGQQALRSTVDRPAWPLRWLR